MLWNYETGQVWQFRTLLSGQGGCYYLGQICLLPIVIAVLSYCLHIQLSFCVPFWTRLSANFLKITFFVCNSSIISVFWFPVLFCHSNPFFLFLFFLILNCVFGQNPCLSFKKKKLKNVKNQLSQPHVAQVTRSQWHQGPSLSEINISPPPHHLSNLIKDHHLIWPSSFISLPLRVFWDLLSCTDIVIVKIHFAWHGSRAEPWFWAWFWAWFICYVLLSVKPGHDDDETDDWQSHHIIIRRGKNPGAQSFKKSRTSRCSQMIRNSILICHH